MIKKSFHFTIISFLALLFSCTVQNKEVSIEQESYKALKILTNTLLDLQVNDTNDINYGGIDCPESGIFHTRAAEAVYPFAVMYKHTSDEKYLKAAVNVGNWLIKQQAEEGEWAETPWTWTGTTADQLLMMNLAYPILEEHLSKEEKENWINSMRRAADYLEKYMSPDFASLNYCPTTAACMATSYNLLGDERYLRKAKLLAHQTIAKMDDDGFLHGEAARIYGVKYGADIGYEMDMSFWGLGLYARLTNDEFIDDKVKHALETHLPFVYPNGIIDGSWGARCYKWTTFGSKTADGCQILFSLYAKENPSYRTAAIRNLNYLMTMIQDGLIGHGPHYFELFDTPPCNYSTFVRSKNLAMAVELGEQGSGPSSPLPSEKKNWIRHYKTIDVALIRTENIMATISAYGYEDKKQWGSGKYTYRPTGGAACNIWIDGHGLLQTSSQTKYYRGEEMHMPVIEQPIQAVTPRIEYQDSIGYFTNLFETEGIVEIDEGRGVFNITTSGELKDEKYLPGGVAYKLAHTFDHNSITKKVTIRYHDRSPLIRIIEPIVEEGGMRFSQEGNKVFIKGGKKEFIFEFLEGDANLVVGQNEENYWYPFPAIKCYPIELVVESPENPYENGNHLKEISYRISVVK